MKQIKQNWIYLLPAVLLVLADQILKLWVRTNLPLYGTQDAWPGIFELCYVQNTGAAFSLLGAHTWLLAIISALASAALLGLMLSGYFRHRAGQLALSLVLGGAVGNLIDRVMLGYVVDMFSLEFIDFAIFNIADIGVTLGGLGFCVYIIFFWQKTDTAQSRRLRRQVLGQKDETDAGTDELFHTVIDDRTDGAINKEEREE